MCVFLRERESGTGEEKKIEEREKREGEEEKKREKK